MMNKKMISRIIALVVVLSLTLTSAVFAMPSGHLKKLAKYNFNYEEAAEYMKGNGIIKGYGNGELGLTDYVKHGDMTVMIVRAFKLSTMIENENFPDVPLDSYFYDAIATAKSLGIAKGDGKHFNANKFVTIGEAILFIERSIKAANSNVVLDENADLDIMYADYSSEELGKPATRAEIAAMLYYVLTGDDGFDVEVPTDEIDNSVIKYTVDEDSLQNFEAEDFTKAFEEIYDDTGYALDYVQFKLPVDNGNLYYVYDEDNPDEIDSANSKFYVLASGTELSIDEITFVPDENYSGIVEIEYNAIDADNDFHTGLIEITVEDLEQLKSISYTTTKNTQLNFNHYNYEEAFKNETNKVFDYITFILPVDEFGTLYYDDDSDGKPEIGEKVGVAEEFALNEIDDIVFVPFNNYDGNTVVKYTIFDEDGETYPGDVKISIEENFVIETIGLTSTGTAINFNLSAELDDLDDDYNFKTITFTDLPGTTVGKLYLDYDNNVFAKEDVSYKINDLNELTFKMNDESTVEINYTAVDSTNDNFTGVISIEFK